MAETAGVEKRLHEAEQRWRRAVERLRAAKSDAGTAQGKARRLSADAALDRATIEAQMAERELVRVADEMRQQRLAALRGNRSRG